MCVHVRVRVRVRSDAIAKMFEVNTIKESSLSPVCVCLCVCACACVRER